MRKMLWFMPRSGSNCQEKNYTAIQEHEHSYLQVLIMTLILPYNRKLPAKFPWRIYSNDTDNALRRRRHVVLLPAAGCAGLVDVVGVVLRVWGVEFGGR